LTAWPMVLNSGEPAGRMTAAADPERERGRKVRAPRKHGAG
jgi:hypothetical protein